MTFGELITFACCVLAVILAILAASVPRAAVRLLAFAAAALAAGLAVQASS
jgi:hypothetical protein